MSIQEILKVAGIDTVLGMGTVFTVLIIISLFIWALGAVFKQNDTAKAPAAAATAKAAEPRVRATAGGAETEVVAVITAAINQFMKNQYGEEVDESQYIVRNIRRATWKHTS